VSTPADLAPSVLNRIALQKAAMDSSSYGAHANMLGARFGVRAAEDGHLTLLRAHAAVAHVGYCCCHPPNACKCHRGLQGPCIERGLRAGYLQDRALIKKNLAQPSGNKKQTLATVGELKKSYNIKSYPIRLRSDSTGHSHKVMIYQHFFLEMVWA
jgi:hypothetical protein